MLGRISTVTLSTPDLPAVTAACQRHIEADEVPPAVAPRPCAPGQLPPGIAMVSFELERLPDVLPGALGPAQTVPGLPYGGRRSRVCVARPPAS